MVEKFHYSKDKSDLSLAESLLDGYVKNSTKNGILVENCEPKCDLDAILFKGIFLRNMKHLMNISS
jgi:hypothetical protein